MKYIKDKEYKIQYLDRKGNEKDTKFTPQKDTNIAGIISGVKEDNKDFFKMVKIEEGKKMESYDKTDELPQNIKDDLKDIVNGKKEKGEVKTDIALESLEALQYIYKDILSEYFPAVVLYLKELLENDTKSLEEKKTLLEDDDDENNDDQEDEEKEDEEELEKKEIEDAEINEKEIESEAAKESETSDENPEQVEAEVSEVIEELPKEPNILLGISVIEANIDVMIADEVAAIEGYKAFLEQVEESVPEELFNKITYEIEEILDDEEDHINKLEAIKAAMEEVS